MFQYFLVRFTRGFGMLFTLCMILGVLSCEVYAHVCHVYQEPIGRGHGNRPRWWVSEANPCECTEMRLGGVNMISYNRPLEEVTFLLNGVLISTDPEEIQGFWGCKEMSASQPPSEDASEQHWSWSWYRPSTWFNRWRHH